MPADAGAGIVAGERGHGRFRLGSTPARAAALSRSGCSQSGIGSAGREAGVVEIVAPAEALRLAVAESSRGSGMARGPDASRRSSERVAPRPRDEVVAILEAGDQRLGEQASLAHAANSSAELRRAKLGRELVEGALARRLVGTPAQEAGAVAEAAAGDLVVADFDHQLRAAAAAIRRARSGPAARPARRVAGEAGRADQCFELRASAPGGPRP